MKDLLEQPQYQFLKSNPYLGRYVILLALAGSYSYGTSNEKSDVDLRGVTLNRPAELLGLTGFEQYVDDKTDTCIYGFNKFIKLLLSCNPNTIELLGENREHYLYLHPIGQKLINNSGMFLSKRAIQSFGGYATAQLRRLQNALARNSCSQQEKEQQMYRSIRHAMHDFAGRYERFEQGSIHLYVDQAVNPEMATEIFMDISLTHYPLRDYKGIWAEMNNIVRDYGKIGKRNKKKDDDHLNKHAMHLIRLFFMAVDILEKGEINTYRRQERELLAEIRNGGFQKADGTFKGEFYTLLADCEKRLEQASQTTKLPDEPDMAAVQQFVMWVNERVVRDEW